VQRVVDALVEEVMATYDDNPRHLLAGLVRPAPRGRRDLRTSRAAQHLWAAALGATIGTADLQHASGVLDRVYRALEEPTA
jgi:hypothetical protein